MQPTKFCHGSNSHENTCVLILFSHIQLLLQTAYLFCRLQIDCTSIYFIEVFLSHLLTQSDQYLYLLFSTVLELVPTYCNAVINYVYLNKVLLTIPLGSMCLYSYFPPQSPSPQQQHCSIVLVLVFRVSIQLTEEYHF